MPSRYDEWCKWEGISACDDAKSEEQGLEQGCHDIKGRLENRGGAPMGVQVFWGVKKR